MRAVAARLVDHPGDRLLEGPVVSEPGEVVPQGCLAGAEVEVLEAGPLCLELGGRLEDLAAHPPRAGEEQAEECDQREQSRQRKGRDGQRCARNDVPAGGPGDGDLRRSDRLRRVPAGHLEHRALARVRGERRDHRERCAAAVEDGQLLSRGDEIVVGPAQQAGERHGRGHRSRRAWGPVRGSPRTPRSERVTHRSRRRRCIQPAPAGAPSPAVSTLVAPLETRSAPTASRRDAPATTPESRPTTLASLAAAAFSCASVAFGLSAAPEAGSALMETSARRMPVSSRWIAAAACSLSDGEPLVLRDPRIVDDRPDHGRDGGQRQDGHGHERQHQPKLDHTQAVSGRQRPRPRALSRRSEGLASVLSGNRKRSDRYGRWWCPPASTRRSQFRPGPSTPKRWPGRERPRRGRWPAGRADSPGQIRIVSPGAGACTWMSARPRPERAARRRSGVPARIGNVP